MSAASEMIAGGPGQNVPGVPGLPEITVAGVSGVPGEPGVPGIIVSGDPGVPGVGRHCVAEVHCNCGGVDWRAASATVFAFSVSGDCKVVSICEPLSSRMSLTGLTSACTMAVIAPCGGGISCGSKLLAALASFTPGGLRSNSEVVESGTV